MNSENKQTRNKDMPLNLLKKRQRNQNEASHSTNDERGFGRGRGRDNRDREFKRDGAGRGNWGTPADEISPHIADSSDCPRCANEEESTLHVCYVIASTLGRFGLHLGNYHLSLQNKMLRYGIRSQITTIFREVSQFLCVAWHIWLARNSYVFNHLVLPPQATITNVLSFAHYTVETFVIGDATLRKDGIYYV